MTEKMGYVLAVILNMVPFSFLRYYPFRRSLRLPLPILVGIYSAALLIEILVYLDIFGHTGGDAFFDKDSLLYDAFIAFYIVFALAVIRESIFKQLYLWFTLALYELSVFGLGIWIESRWQAALGWPRFLLMDGAVLLTLLLTLPPAIYFLRRMEPFLALDRPDMWRWSWLPAASFFVMNWVYIVFDVQQFGEMAICRILSLAASLLSLLLLLWIFESQQKKAVLTQHLQMAQALYHQQQEKAVGAEKQAEETKAIYQHLQEVVAHLRDCVERQDAAGLEERIKAEQKMLLQTSAARHFCQQELLDTILCQADAQAKLAGIRAEMRVLLRGSVGMEDIDVCVLFGNLLENAITGCKELPENQRWFTLHISSIGGMVAITLDNSCAAEKIHQEGTTFYSAKRGYQESGIGIGSICSVAAKYGGEAEFKCEGGVFYASILLQQGANGKEGIVDENCNIG